MPKCQNDLTGYAQKKVVLYIAVRILVVLSPLFSMV
jgi:hypothetical protein